MIEEKSLFCKDHVDGLNSTDYHSSTIEQWNELASYNRKQHDSCKVVRFIMLIYIFE